MSGVTPDRGDHARARRHATTGGESGEYEQAPGRPVGSQRARARETSMVMSQTHFSAPSRVSATPLARSSTSTTAPGCSGLRRVLGVLGAAQAAWRASPDDGVPRVVVRPQVLRGWLGSVEPVASEESRRSGRRRGVRVAGVRPRWQGSGNPGMQGEQGHGRWARDRRGPQREVAGRDLGYVAAGGRRGRGRAVLTGR